MTPAPAYDLQPAYEFTTPVFAGFIRPAGHLHGLVLSHDSQERPITRPGACLLNLEHYTAAGRAGIFVPRDQVTHTHRIDRHGLEISFSAAPDWAVEARIHYALLGPDTIEARFSFHFLQDFDRFEAFIASYLPAGTPPPWIKSMGMWQRPPIDPSARDQVFVPRDEAARQVLTDGRWQVLFDRGYGYRLTPETYTLPVQVSVLGVEEDPGELPARPVLIQMAEQHHCLALSPNRFAPAHDFSLLGESVQAGDTQETCLRLVYRTLTSFEEVEALCQEFVCAR
jgi:hypothetical protein